MDAAQVPAVFIKASSGWLSAEQSRRLRPFEHVLAGAFHVGTLDPHAFTSAS
jgi:hypothetical protein